MHKKPGTVRIWPKRNRAGRDQTGRDRTGRDQTGRDQTGRDRTGRDQTGRKRLLEVRDEAGRGQRGRNRSEDLRSCRARESADNTDGSWRDAQSDQCNPLLSESKMHETLKKARKDRHYYGNVFLFHDFTRWRPPDY